MRRTVLSTIAFIILTTGLLFTSSCGEEEGNQKPTCIINNPAPGSDIIKGDTVQISVEAEDDDGTVKEVWIYIDGKRFTSTSVVPYQFDWYTGNVSLGRHRIELFALDNNEEEGKDEVIVNVVRGSEAPVAAFSADDTIVETGTSIQFTDESTGEPTEWQWNFGDGSTSSQQNPAHVYSSEGIYTVDLTVENENGSDTKTKNNYIEVSNGGGGGTVNLEWVVVDGGTFQMGCTSEQSPNCDDDETPVHPVSLSSFEITQYEITNAQYAEFLNDINCSSDGSYNDDEYGNVEYIAMDDSDCQINYSDGQFGVESDKENHPVIMVSWYGANAFAQWAGGRLPTEAEWEFAARGGNQSQGYEYSGSDYLNEVGWYYNNANTTTHEVGQKQPNELGIYDMSGNVWEWCSDWYNNDYYSNSPENNPQGPESGSDRVIRGGSWSNSDGHCRVANRKRDLPFSSYNGNGFRIAK